jgi:hypothetical protein
MKLDLSGTTVGLVVELSVLRTVLGTLNIAGRHWWVAGDLTDAAAHGSVTIAHGYEDCYDRLNTLYFETPVLAHEVTSWGDRQVPLLIERSQWMSREPGYHVERGWISQDSASDLDSAFYPMQNALIDRMQRQG